MDVAKAGNGERGTGNGERGTGNEQGEREDENWEQNEVADKARFQVRFCFQFFIFPFPMLVPRPLPVLRLSNIPLSCTGRKNRFTSDGSRGWSRKRSRKTAYDLENIKNGCRKRSHKGDGVEVGSRSGRINQSQCTFPSFVIGFFSSSASTCDSDDPVLT